MLVDYGKHKCWKVVNSRLLQLQLKMHAVQGWCAFLVQSAAAPQMM